MTGERPKPAAGVPASSWKRLVPSPWVDCAVCGWRHYPDTSHRQGAQLATSCASCGSALPEPEVPGSDG